MDKAIGVGMNKIATGAASPVLLIAGSAVVGGFQSEADLLEDILLFADTDVAAVFHAIAHYHPRLVVVQRDLLPTARAAEIIGRIRTDPDPAVSHVQIRVLSDVHAYIQLVQDRVGLDEAIAARGDRLPPEYDGRRFARRFRMRAGIDVRVDGTAARLTELSQTGAQLIVPTLLRPKQHVRIRLTDDGEVIRLPATVVWASLEPSRGSGAPPGYRVGVKFIDATPEGLEAFDARNRQDDRVWP